jgi:predicted ester cyclase
VSGAEENNKALVRRFIVESFKGNIDIIDELLASDFVDLSLQPGQEQGREGYKRSAVEINAIFSNPSVTIEKQVAEGDEVVTWYSGTGTHVRPVLGIAPSGERKTMTGVNWHRIVGGKIVEERSLGDSRPITLPALEQEWRQRERIEQDMQVARSIQQASLPEEVPTLPGWQISPFYQPAREVGGDFYDFHFLSEGRLGLVMGDATGKGVPAALVMSTTLGMLQAVSQTLDSSSPGEVFGQVNETLVARIPSNMFVTCFYAILDPKSGTLSYANAGHDLPYLWHGGAAEELRARGMPLGLMPGMHYEQKEIVLHKGDSALLYTDGLVEAHDPQREMFGFPRLQALISEHGEEERSLEEALLKELYAFVGESWEQEDDITLLTLRRS